MMKHWLCFVLAAGLIGALSAENPREWTGLFRKTNGEIVGIGEMHEFGKGEIFVNYSNGETGRLFELTRDGAKVSHAIGEASPPPVHTLSRKADRIFLDDESLRSIPVARRAFEVQNGAVRLAGELVFIAGQKPKGVLVFVHGSGDGPYRAYDLWTNLFLSRGWAVVAYDKRGSGKSTGDWHEANFQLLADDVRAVIRWTRSQDALSKLRLGLWGASQAGWIIPQVASDNLVDFAIVQAGPSTPSDDFIGQTLESELAAYGFSPDEIARARAYYALDLAVSRKIRPFDEIKAAYKKASAEGAEWILKPPDPPDSPDRKFMATIAGFDPAPYWRKVQIPVLALFGGKDHIVPAEPNRSRLEHLVAEAGNKNVRIVTLENDNHLNMLAKTGVRTEYASLNRLDPDYLKTIGEFLESVSR